jgi:hypothetical protein
VTKNLPIYEHFRDASRPPSRCLKAAGSKCSIWTSRVCSPEGSHKISSHHLWNGWLISTIWIYCPTKIFPVCPLFHLQTCICVQRYIYIYTYTHIIMCIYICIHIFWSIISHYIRIIWLLMSCNIKCLLVSHNSYWKACSSPLYHHIFFHSFK